MITSTTLLLATLVFNAASVLGAPIRIPTAPDVVARAVVDDPVLLPRAASIIDVQPVRKRSVEGNSNRPRLARDVAPEVDTRDTASSESVSVRDSPPEVEEELARRFPRRALYERHIAKRSPEPAPSPPSEPPVEARSTPEPVRRFARRALYDRHAEPSEPAPPVEARSDGSPDPDPHFVRRANPELFEKRSAPITDNFPREPEPAPAPEPVPVPSPAPEPEVKPRSEEPVRKFPRRVLAERYGNTKRQEETTEPPAEEPKPETPEPTPSATTTPTSSATTTTSTATTTPSAPGLPANLDFNKVIADAIVTGTTNTVKHTQGQKIAEWKDTKITIQITQQQNSDVKLEPVPGSSSTAPTSTTAPTGTPTPSSTTTPTTTPTPTGTDAPTQPESTSTTSTSTDAPPAEATAGAESKEGEGAGGPAKPEASSGSQPGGETAADTTTPPAKRDIDDASAAAEPIAKRHLGLAGSLLASWTRRSVPN